MNANKMDGRICLVTGASSGIGKEVARGLAGMGATVTMVARNRRRGQTALEQLRTKTGSTRLELLICDFASLESVRTLAADFLNKHDALHVLVNNAGLVRLRRTLTVDGYETTFQVNYLSHFLLTNLLLGALKKGAPSRIVNVSSVAHFGGRLDFDNLQLEKGYAIMKAYSNSKLDLVLFTKELARRLEGTGVTVNSLHPGAIATNIWGNQLGPARVLARVLRLAMPGPAKGAQTPLYLASSTEVSDVSGEYFERKLIRPSSPISSDIAAAKRLWQVSEEMVGLHFAE